MSYNERLKRNITLFYIVGFLWHLEFTIPVWVAFLTRILSFSQIALFYAIGYGLTIVLELPTGALADLIGRRKSLFLGWFLSGGALIYVVFATQPWMFLISYIVRGIGDALVSGSDTALVYDTHKELGIEKEYSKYVAKVGLLIRAALSIGIFTGGLLYTFGVGIPYLALGGVHLFSLIFVYLLVEPHIDSEKFTLRSYLQQTKRGFQELTKSVYSRKLSIYYVLVGGITWACMTYFNQPFAADLAYTAEEMSILFGLIYLVNAIVILLIAQKSTIFTKERILILLPALMVLGLLPGAVASKWAAPILIFLILVAGSARFAFLGQYINEGFESKLRATAVSSLNMLISFLVIVSITIGGRVQDIFGTPIIFTALGVLSLVFVLPRGIELAKIEKKSIITI